MVNDVGRGFREIAHTADWQLEVWAPELPELFKLAAQGMYKLANVEVAQTARINRKLALTADDLETLLVNFLSELLFLGESEGLAFDQISLSLKGLQLYAQLSGAEILRQDKEIKAVTFHNLEILYLDELFRVQIVFDV
ncbi:MAG: archease [Anaerolineales bacterium]